MGGVIYLDEFRKTKRENELDKEFEEDLKEIRDLIHKIGVYNISLNNN